MPAYIFHFLPSVPDECALELRRCQDAAAARRLSEALLRARPRRRGVEVWSAEGLVYRRGEQPNGVSRILAAATGEHTPH